MKSVAPSVKGALIFPFLLFALLSTTLSTGRLSAQEEEQLTPSHVYQHAERLIAEIELIRRFEGVTEPARDPGTQINKLPIHVVQKAVELMDKVRRYQQSLGMDPLTIDPLPFERMTPLIAFEAVNSVLSNIREVKGRLGIGEAIEPVPFRSGKTPTEVYELLWRASYLLDGVVEETTPSEVLAKERQAYRDLLLISEALDSAPPEESRTYENKEPRDVLMENYVTMYRLARLQRALGMVPFYVPPLPGGEITPSNAYDTAGTIVGELHRIKTTLGVTVPSPPLERFEEATPSDVYAVARLIQKGLETLFEEIEEGEA